MGRWLSIWESVLRSDLQATAVGLAAIAFFTFFEWAAPAQPGQSWRGRGRNLLFLVQFKLLGSAALALWYLFGPRLSPLPLPQDPGLLARAGLVAANLLAIDFLYFWYHRAQHRFAFLWAIHELHHADTELNATSSYRTYWLEAPVQSMLVTTPTLLLFGGLGPRHGYTVLGFSLFFLIFSHANLRLRLGPLTPWLIGPQVHRVHHSRLPGHRDTNFAQYFPFLDRLFGTFHEPARDEFPPTGADALPADASLARVLTEPLRIWSGRRETVG